MDHYNNLRWRWRRFVDFYVDTQGNGTEAMRRLGFKGRRPEVAAWKLLQKLDVRAAIDERRAMVARAADVSSADVVDIIWQSIERARKKGDEKSVLRGAELLGNYRKMFTQRHEVGGPNGGAIPVEHSGTIETTDPAEAMRQYQEMVKACG